MMTLVKCDDLSKQPPKFLQPPLSKPLIGLKMKLSVLCPLFFMFFIFPLIFDKFVAADSTEYEECEKPFSCGTNKVNLSYPFYDGQNRPSYCGYRGFQIDCSSAFPKISMSSQIYYLLSMNTTSETISVVGQNLYDGDCPQNLFNIDTDLYKYALTNDNITLFYDCPEQLVGFQIMCTNPNSNSSDNNLNQVTYYVTQNFGSSQATNSTAACQNSITVPTLLSQANPNIFKSGFDLQWIAENKRCDGCRVSGGECASNTALTKFTCYCADGSYDSNCHGNNKSSKTGVIIACISASAICTLTILMICLKRSSSWKERFSRREGRVDVEAFLRGQGSSGPKRYTYSDLKKITNAFKHKLGEGGYGSVYKGTLQNGKLVAVKMLHKSKEEAEEFINEVASIGNTNHVNVVKLFGFCYEGHRRALVYEFMVNGSLEKFLCKGESDSHSLGWSTLLNISVGVARGLEYLHRGCNTRILHFDIKPHNILLDENFCPKIADFGLAKSCPQKDSIISMSEARGTIGYIAPEVFLKSFGGVSYKSDVYSYGMLVLEMVGCRRKVDVVGEVSSEQYFPQWIYEQLEVGEENEQETVEIDEEMETQRKMIVVSLWCVKTNPSSRPTMSEVVDMLEGKPQTLQIPRASSLSLSTSSEHVIPTSYSLSMDVAKTQSDIK